MIKRAAFVLLAFVFGLNLASCNKQEESANPVIRSFIQGVVTVDGEGLSGAYVLLDNNFRLMTMTNSYGQFQIYEVTTGEHSLKIQKNLDNGSSIDYTLVRNISNETVNLGEIRFAKTPTLYIDTLSVVNSVIIKWTRTSEKDFKEYAVYRKNSSDVSDNSGALVYKSSNIADTAFTDVSLAKGATAYYRVYVYSTSGKTYGSTVEGVNAEPKNYITNGSFENASFGSRPDNWTYVNQGVSNFDYFKISPSYVKDGKLSLQIYWTDSVANYSHQSTLYQKIQTNLLVPGKNYRFSFWAKSDTGQIGVYLYLGDKMNYLSIPGKQDWTEKSFTFQMNQSIQDMRIEIISSGDFSKRVKGWLDNLKLLELK